MVKMRVYEYAKQYNISSKEIISKLKELNIEVTNHMATIEADAMKKLDGIYKKENNTETSVKNPVQKQPQNAAIRSASDEGKGETVKIKTAPKKASTQSQSNTNNRNKGKNNKSIIKIKIKVKIRKTFSNHSPPEKKKEKELPAKITFSESLTVGELAKKLYREPSEIIKKLFLLGVMATINQDLDKDAIELIAGEYGVEVEEEIKVDITDLEVYFAEDNEEDLVETTTCCYNYGTR